MEELAKAVTTMAQLLEQQQQTQHRPRIEIASYQEGEDIESFLETFEGVMQLHHAPLEEWVPHLIPKLQGKARDACAGLTYEEPYDEIKEVLKRRFDITTEGCQRSLRGLNFEVVKRHDA